MNKKTRNYMIIGFIIVSIIFAVKMGLMPFSFTEIKPSNSYSQWFAPRDFQGFPIGIPSEGIVTTYKIGNTIFEQKSMSNGLVFYINGNSIGTLNPDNYKIFYNDKSIDFSVYYSKDSWDFYPDGKVVPHCKGGYGYGNCYTMNIKPAYMTTSISPSAAVPSGGSAPDFSEAWSNIQANQYNGFDLSISQASFFFEDSTEGVNIINLNIYNSAADLTEIKLYTYVEAVDSLENKILYDDYTKNIALIYGNNNIQIPLKKYPWGSYKIYAQLLIPMKDVNNNVVLYFPLTEIKNKLFLINPKKETLTLLYGLGLPEGYVFQQSSDSSLNSVDSGNCNIDPRCVIVRDDLKGLPCVQVGCPVSTDYSYECTSTGLCSEFISQALQCSSNSDCGLDKVCDTITGVCYKETIINYLMQCSTASDCGVPCSTVAVNCLSIEGSMKCVYEGECTPVFVPHDCNTKGCDEGYSCNSERGTCERTVTNTVESEKIITEIQYVNNPSANISVTDTKQVSIEPNRYDRLKYLASKYWWILLFVIVIVVYGFKKIKRFFK